MPELPEVETVRRVLKENLLDRKIVDIKIKYEPIVDIDSNEFINNTLNKTIKDIKRLGKFLIFELNDGNIISHLRMEGKYFYTNDLSIDNKHVHLIYTLDNGYYLMYQDVRKFGRITYKNNDELYTTKPLNNVGYDLILEKEFKIDIIYDKIKSRNTPIKTTLLDQSIVSGLGNIYVDEVLFDSHIDPNRESKSITKNEVKSILDSSRKILSKAIEFKGTTIRSYTSSLGVKGEFQNFLKVHTKTKCPICNRNIIKCKIGGRTTYYCAFCER